VSWYVTKIEADREGKPVRVYHRNGGPYAIAGSRDCHKATLSWTHPVNEKAGCPVCTPEKASAK